MFGKFGVVVMAASLAISGTALAADANKSALPAGKPAGVKQAAWTYVNGHWVWLVGGAVVIGGVALVASGGNNGGLSNCTLPGCTPPTTTTTTTPTTTTTTTTTTP